MAPRSEASLHEALGDQIPQQSAPGCISPEQRTCLRLGAPSHRGSLIDDATDGGYDDGTRLHIAAATVSPQPAVRLFCTTTAACF